MVADVQIIARLLSLLLCCTACCCKVHLCGFNVPWLLKKNVGVNRNQMIPGIVEVSLPVEGDD